MNFQQWITLQEKTDPDAELLAQIAAGDESAFEGLIQRWQPRIRGWAKKKFGRDAADDIAQEALMNIVRAIQAGKIPDNFAPWAWQVSKNSAISWLRKNSNRELTGDPEETALNQSGQRNASGQPLIQGDTPDNPHNIATGNETHADLHAALNQMKPLQRDILMRRYFNQETEGESAAGLNIPQGTVKSRTNMAKAELEKLMRQNGYGT